ncbi:cytochrome c [Paraburkholderia sp. J76]|uniref:c-type cytochrome n=1 Tax=Paraburkholderia sp. J76 TaxID=2805439 RepID=UPI002ABE0B3E|nr:cytochrome c [Paraburkholderia sp. J76]
MKSRITASILAGAMLALAGLSLSACGDGGAHKTDATAQSQMQNADAEQIARGRYLARAADCAACHTRPDGAPYAGGVRLQSAFGTFYGTNITPDKEHGIGKWSADDFYRALHDGVSPNGQLYPAMPYTSYRSMSREDSDAIYAFLMSRAPAPVTDKDHELSFPFNLRFGVWFWKLLFLKDAMPDASQGHSADWSRGRYLATALGHCAECHTPRGAAGQLDGAQALSGGAIGRITAPDITPAALAQRGWTAADLQTYFASGVAPQGSAFGEMHSVVQLSTQYLSRDDLRALSVYLLGDSPPAAQSVPAQMSASADNLAAGRGIYLAVCAGCHGAEGEGKPHVAVAMRGNSTLREHDPHNLVVSVLDGIEAQAFPGFERMQDMPGFAKTLSDDEIAQLASYLRAQWGGQSPDVSAQQVRKLRQ